MNSSLVTIAEFPSGADEIEYLCRGVDFLF